MCKSNNENLCITSVVETFKEIQTLQAEDDRQPVFVPKPREVDGEVKVTR